MTAVDNWVPRPTDRRPHTDRSLAAVLVHLLAAETGLDAREIMAPARNGAVASRARQMAMYLAHTGLSWTQERTGAAFGRDRSTVAYACARIEDLRDDGAVDAQLTRLETWLRAVPAEGPWQ